MQHDLNIIDTKSMIKEFNPDFTDDQIQARIDLIEKEKSNKLDNIMLFNGEENKPNQSDPNDNESTKIKEPSQQQSEQQSEPSQLPPQTKPEQENTARSEILNGAQVSSLLEITQLYSSGQISRDSAINLIMIAFNMTFEEANSILGSTKVKVNNVETTKTSSQSSRQVQPSTEGSGSSRNNKPD